MQQLSTSWLLFVQALLASHPEVYNHVLYNLKTDLRRQLAAAPREEWQAKCQLFGPETLLKAMGVTDVEQFVRELDSTTGQRSAMYHESEKADVVPWCRP